MGPHRCPHFWHPLRQLVLKISMICSSLVSICFLWSRRNWCFTGSARECSFYSQTLFRLCTSHMKNLKPFEPRVCSFARNRESTLKLFVPLSAYMCIHTKEEINVELVGKCCKGELGPILGHWRHKNRDFRSLNPSSYSAWQRKMLGTIEVLV